MSSTKVILVTGSNTGIGYELVHLLAAQGHTVYLASRKEQAGLDAVSQIKKEKGLSVKYVKLDVTDVSSIKAAVAQIEKDEGRLNVLVNNAGISKMEVQHSAIEPDLDAIRGTFETNVIGTIQTTTAFLPLLRKSNTPETPSVILNVSTDMASNSFMASPKGFLHDVVAYNTSKAAQNSYTIALAKNLEAEDIKVNAVTPGFTSTKLNGFSPGGKTAEDGAKVLMKWALLEKNDRTGVFAYDGGDWSW